MKATIFALTALLLYDVLLNHSMVLKRAGAKAGDAAHAYSTWNNGG